MKKMDFTDIFLLSMALGAGSVLFLTEEVVNTVPLATYLGMLVMGAAVNVISSWFIHNPMGRTVLRFIGIASILLTWLGVYLLGVSQGVASVLYFCGTLLCLGLCWYRVYLKFRKRQ